jgi:hypothetical protein
MHSRGKSLCCEREKGRKRNEKERKEGLTGTLGSGKWLGTWSQSWKRNTECVRRNRKSVKRYAYGSIRKVSTRDYSPWKKP